MVLLRDIPVSARYFWQASAGDQISTIVEDRDLGGNKRKLSANQVLVMALNEVAVDEGQGFFYHLPSREAWKTKDDKSLLPESRVHTAPGANYPTIIYMQYAWGEKGRQRFETDSHRDRYLKSNAMINPPLPHTPLFAIQYLGFDRSPIYATNGDSLAIFATKTAYYIANTSKLQRILGKWDFNKRQASGPDPGLRLNQAPFLWKTEVDVLDKRRAFQPFELVTTRSLYDAIVARCTQFTTDCVPATFKASDLRDVIPRPLQPEQGISLGESGVLSADPATRRGIRKTRREVGEHSASQSGDDSKSDNLDEDSYA